MWKFFKKFSKFLGYVFLSVVVGLLVLVDLFLFDICNPLETSVVCRLANETGKYADSRRRTVLLSWNSTMGTAHVGGTSFSKGKSEKDTLTFHKNGDFTLGYGQGVVMCRDKDCRKRVTVDKIVYWHYDHKKYRVVSWSEYPLSPVTDADGDGFIEDYRAVRPG